MTGPKIRLKVEFDRDPDSGQGVDPDMAASWGGFQLWSGEDNLCQYLACGHVADTTHWYLLPLLEWFVENWDRIFHESRIPEGIKTERTARESWLESDPLDLDGPKAAAAESWWHGHALRSAAHGGIFPDVFMRRRINALEVSWGHTPVPGAPADFRFLAPRGRSLSPVSEAAASLHDAIGQAIGKLKARRQSPRISGLADAHAAIRAARPERAKWLAGWASVPEWARPLIPKLEPGLAVPLVPAPLALFGAMSPSIRAEDVATVLDVLASTGGSGPSPLDSETSARDPWEQGYQFAERARTHLGLAGDQLPELSDVLDRLGVRQRDITLSDPRVRAIALCGGTYAPTIAVNMSCPINQSVPGKRFTVAHEICHLLFDQESGVPLAVTSGPWAPKEIEQRANAFAAMFLMPAGVCRELAAQILGPEGWTAEAVRHVARSLQTSYKGTLGHLQNLDLIERYDAELLEEV